MYVYTCVLMNMWVGYSSLLQLLKQNDNIDPVTLERPSGMVGRN